jgi:membrane protein implicated in regulation of membrane protease activity
VLFIVFLIIEALTFNLITIWFAIASIGAYIATCFTSDFLVQCTVFVVLAVITLILTKPFVRRLVKNNKHIKTNLDAVIGSTGIVTSDINHDIGRVTTHGKDWAAISDEVINTGSEVEILDIKGVKLVVKKRGVDN